MRRIVLAVIVLLGICCNPLYAQQKAKWTVMVYLDCNNDLEAAELENLKDMIAVGSTPAVNIVVLCARSANGDEDEGYSNAPVANLPDWSTGKLLYVQKGKLVELADWGAVNMADGATLEKFVATVGAKYPADHFALIIGDHGMSWPGCCGDEREGHESDILTVRAISHALARFQEAHQQVDLVGFDACLMGNYETAYGLTGHAHYMVGSEELEPSTGWAFKTTFTRLVQNPDLDGAAFGKHIATDYLEQFSRSEDEDMQSLAVGATLSVIDLSQMGPLVSAVDRLGAALHGALQADRRQRWIRLSAARKRAEEYGKSSEKGEEGSQVFDLGHFARVVAKEMPNSEAGSAAAAVEAALRGAVLLSVHGSGHPAASGLSVFIPRQKSTLEENEPVAYRDVPHVADSTWLQFLATFTGSTALQSSRPGIGELVASGHVIGKSHPSIKLTSKTDADDIDDAWFVLARQEGDRMLIMGQMAADFENGHLSETWDGSWFTLTCGKTSIVALMASLDEIEGQDDVYLAQVPAQYKRARGGEWRACTLHFQVRFKKEGGLDGRFLSAFSNSKMGQTQVLLRAGDVVRPVFLAVDAEGRETEVTSDSRDQHLVIGKSPIQVDYEGLAPGKYQVGFLLTDYAGKSVSQTTEVVVEEDADESSRAALSVRRGRSAFPHARNHRAYREQGVTK